MYNLWLSRAQRIRCARECGPYTIAGSLQHGLAARWTHRFLLLLFFFSVVLYANSITLCTRNGPHQKHQVYNKLYGTHCQRHVVSRVAQLRRTLRLSITLSTTTILRSRDKASYMHYLRELEVARWLLRQLSARVSSDNCPSDHFDVERRNDWPRLYLSRERNVINYFCGAC